ncbi:MAG: metallophosphoesterase family protein [Clostridia bacterium]|nr:metallophosphoesterase family protein [Clostridia bacterium]
MEKIAIISDVHGNITALNTVLKDIEDRGIKRIFCLGDMLIKCSAPSECVDKILNTCEVVVKGNCEERTVETPRIEEHLWNQRKLSDKQKEKIKDLPLSYDFKMSGYNIRIMHASPNSIHQKAYFWDFDSEFSNRMNTMFENTEYLNNLDSEVPDIVIFGHIHKPFLIRLKNKMLINPGAVSNTSDLVTINGKDYTYGSYLILEGEFGSEKISEISYKIVKFIYDHKKEAEQILKTDMPNKENAYREIYTGKYFDRKVLEKGM